MAGALADLRRAAHRARAEPLDRGALVGTDHHDVQVLAHELVVVLRVGDRRFEQLGPITRDRTRRVSQDSSRFHNRLAANVITHQSRLARRRAHVLGLRSDDRRRRSGLALNTPPSRRRRSRLLPLRLSRLPPPPPRRLRLLGRLRVLINLSLGLKDDILSRFLSLNISRSRLNLVNLGRGGRVRIGGTRVRSSGLPFGAGGAPCLRRGCALSVSGLATSATGSLWLVRLGSAHRLFPVPACPRNNRVGTNSPSLCPTIDSLMNTGTCLRPSWTAIVCPTISGKIVDARDQVRSIRFSPEVFIASIRAIRRSSTNGPFLLERLIAAYPYPFCVHGRCSGRCPCPSCGCDTPASGRPMASPDGAREWSSPRHRRAGGRRGSSRSRVSAGARPCGACARSCRS